MNRSRDVSMRQTYRYGSRLGRMLELSMVTFGSRQIPTIFLQHLQNIFDFVLFHIIDCFDYAGKGTNNNTFKQISCIKSIKTRWYILSFCKQKSIKSYRLRLWDSLSFITKKMTTKWLERQIIFSESLIWPIILAIRLDNANLLIGNISLTKNFICHTLTDRH